MLRIHRPQRIAVPLHTMPFGEPFIWQDVDPSTDDDRVGPFTRIHFDGPIFDEHGNKYGPIVMNLETGVAEVAAASTKVVRIHAELSFTVRGQP